MKWILICLCGLSLHAQALIYTPKNLNRATADIVVVLHGCLQSPDAMQAATGFDKIADERNWIVLYPRAPWHPMGCWAWYEKENQKPGSGQLQQIVDEIEEVRERYQVGGNVFATGISSGGTTVAGLMACYPDLLAAAAIHSAPVYAAASTVSDAIRVLERGTAGIDNSKAPCKMSDFNGRTMILQGTDDRVVHPSHAEFILSQVLTGKGSFRVEKSLGEANDLSYEHSRYFKGKKAKAELVMIDGLRWDPLESTCRHASLSIL